MNLIFDLDKVLFKKIKQTLLFNKRVLDYPGKKFYYSPITPKITFGCHLILFIASIYVGIIFVNYIFIYTLFIFISAIRVLHKVIHKNPLFILNGDKLFYSHTDTWYDLNDTIIYKGNIGKYNYSGTLIIEIEDWNKKYYENLWYIEDDDVLIKNLEKYLKEQ